MTACLVCLGMTLLEELEWGEVAEGLGWTDGALDALPGQKLSVQGGHLGGEVCDSTLVRLRSFQAGRPQRTLTYANGH